jgi:hypothetical protein
MNEHTGQICIICRWDKNRQDTTHMLPDVHDDCDNWDLPTMMQTACHTVWEMIRRTRYGGLKAMCVLVYHVDRNHEHTKHNL